MGIMLAAPIRQLATTSNNANGTISLWYVRWRSNIDTSKLSIQAKKPAIGIGEVTIGSGDDSKSHIWFP